MNNFTISDFYHFDGLPDIGVFLFALSGYVNIVFFDGVKKLQANTELCLKLKNVDSLVFDFQLVEVFQLKIVVNSFDDSLPDSFVNESFINFSLHENEILVNSLEI